MWLVTMGLGNFKPYNFLWNLRNGQMLTKKEKKWAMNIWWPRPFMWLSIMTFCMPRTYGPLTLDRSFCGILVLYCLGLGPVSIYIPIFDPKKRSRKPQANDLNTLNLVYNLPRIMMARPSTNPLANLWIHL